MVGFCESGAVAIALVRPHLRPAAEQRSDADAAGATAREVTSEESDWSNTEPCGRTGWQCMVPFDVLAPAFVRRGEEAVARGTSRTAGEKVERRVETMAFVGVGTTARDICDAIAAPVPTVGVPISAKYSPPCRRSTRTRRAR
jgi:hypothetical protein